jgi:hypothetical protein
MKPIRFAFLSALLILIMGCQEQQPNVVQQAAPAMPDWILNPGEGVVGSSVIHVKGRHYQEQLAISRARQELAARQGVKVEYIQLSQEVVHNDSANVKVSRSGSEEVTGKTVRAKVVNKWIDPRTREIFVLLMPI